MKKIIFPLIAFAFVGMAFGYANGDDDKKGTPSLELGEKAPLPSLKMKDVSGKSLSLQDIKKENGVLVVFSCNTCPFVVGGNGLGEGWEGRYNSVYDNCSKNNIGMVLVNSNEAKRDGDDSMSKMQARAKEKAYKSYYVVDSKSKLANAFGAKTTPHVYLFDKDLKLVYKGAIDDDNSSANTVKAHYLATAVKQLTNGEKIDPGTTRNKGCSIKRVKK